MRLNRFHTSAARLTRRFAGGRAERGTGRPDAVVLTKLRRYRRLSAQDASQRVVADPRDGRIGRNETVRRPDNRLC